MSENQLNRQLAAGIRAAQQGNRQRARELLEGVLRQDRNNEQAWIWLASVVESQRERRLSLERVLKINPNNRPAQQALNSMVGVLGSGEARGSVDFAAISAAAKTPPPVVAGRNPTPAERAGTPNGGGNNIVPFLFAGAIILGLLLAGSIFIPPLLAPAPTATPIPIIESPTDAGPTRDPSIPTETPTIPPTATFDAASVGEIATNTPLGPTFTPTVTLTPSETPMPTATLPALVNYRFLVRGVQGAAGSSILTLDGDGTGINNLLQGVDDFDFDAQSGLIAYTRSIEIAMPTVVVPATPIPVSTSANSNATQNSPGGLVVNTSSVATTSQISRLFIASIGSIESETEITSSSIPSAYEPAISPSGGFIAFVSDQDGDAEIFLYDVRTRLSEQITDNIGIVDTQPEWSADGTRLIFSSDRESIGNNDLFTLDPFAPVPEDTIERITDSRGRDIQPQLSPDGTQIVYLNDNSGDVSVRIANIDGRSTRNLTFNPDWIYNNPVWSLDGNYIFYSSSPPDSEVQQIRAYAPSTNSEIILPVGSVNILQVLPRE